MILFFVPNTPDSVNFNMSEPLNKEVLRVPADIFHIFQFLGLFPVPISNGFAKTVLLKCVSFSNSLIVVIITCLSLYFSTEIFDQTNAIGLFVDVVQILAPILTHLVICIEAQRRHKAHKIYWLQFEKIYQITLNLDAELEESLKRMTNRFRINFIVLCSVTLFIEMRILYGIVDNFWVYSRLAAEFSFIGCRLGLLQFCYYVDSVNFLLQRLEKEIRIISNESRSQLKSVEWEMESQISYKRISIAEKAIREILQLTSILNFTFRWSLLANMTNNFLSITIAFYWNYRSLYFNNLKYQAGR